MNEHKEKLKPFLDDIKKIKSNNIAIIIRHSIREDYSSSKRMHEFFLTEEGKKLAFWFGKNLPKDRKIRIFHSPIKRCKDTAFFIKEGIESNGHRVELVEEKKILDFVTNCEKFELIIKKNPNVKFIEKWFGREIDRDIIDYPENCLKKQMNEIISYMKKQNERTLNIYISHDGNIFIIRDFILKVKSKEYWPDFLEGIIFSKEKNKIKLKWRNFEKIIDWKI